MHRTRLVAVALAVILGLPAIGLAVPISDTKGLITFTKTVGLGPSCAPQGQTGITVMPGTTVTYCYTIVSTDKLTLTLESLDDDQLGHLYSPLCPGCTASPVPAPANFVLTPTVPFVLTTTAQIFRTTLNVATWTVNFADPVTVSVQSQARVSVPSTAKAPTLSGVGLALVAFALLVVGAMQLTFSKKGAR
jgi:hypothetical protein